MMSNHNLSYHYGTYYSLTMWLNFTWKMKTSKFKGYVKKEIGLAMDNVDDNMSLHTKFKIKIEKLTQKLMESLANLSKQYLNTIIQENFLKEKPATEEDLQLAEEKFGKEMAVIKGHMKNKKRTSPREATISITLEIMQDHKDVDICIDTMSFNKMEFLETISKIICYRMAIWVPKRKNFSYRGVLE